MPPVLLPKPTHVRQLAGSLTLDSRSTLWCPQPPARPVARLLRSLLSPSTGLDLSDAGAGAGERATIRLLLDPEVAVAGGPESYRLRVDEDGVLASALTPSGLVNAVQTLRQLLPPLVYSPGPERAAWVLPAVEIEDAPRFAWRGAMLDVARHFLPLSFLYRFVDLIALHKLNVLHLHLNDDQGWRMPIERYPRLVEVGGWRKETRLGHQGDRSRRSPVFDGTPHGGWYTKDQLRGLIAYAAERNVTVVPEIDLPGHAQAAIAAYPELGSAGPLEVWTSWGVSPHVLDLSEGTVELCRQVWDEVIDVFPSTYVHIGGDECPRREWWASAAVKARAASLGLESVDALQSWFTRRLAAHLHGAGRRIVGWDEILEGGPLPEGATVMSWRGEKGGIEAAAHGFDVVMCPESPCYLDSYQDPGPDEPLGFGRLNTLEDVYAWDPVPAELDPSRAGRVLGTQFTLWSEYLPEPGDVEYMAFPRGAALAEVAWTSGERDLVDFESRLSAHLERLDVLGVNYRPRRGPHPWQRGGTGARRRFHPSPSTAQ